MNVTVILTSLVLALVLAPSLWKETRRAPGGGGETVVAGEVIRPPADDRGAAQSTFREMAATEGETFDVTLDHDPASRYGWELAGPLDESVVRLLGKGCREDPGSPWGRVEDWRFEAVGPGEAFIIMAYGQPGDPYPLKTDTRHLVVTSLPAKE